MLSSLPGHQRHGVAGGFQQRGIVGGARRRRRGAARAAAAKRNACGVCARNRPSRGTVPAITPSAPRFSVSATGTAGMAPSCVSQRRQQRGDRCPAGCTGGRRRAPARCRARAAPAPPARRARCPGAWRRRRRRQMRQAGQRGRDRRGVADRLQQGRPARPAASAAWRMHRLAGEGEELLRRVGAEAGCRCRRRPGWRRCAGRVRHGGATSPRDAARQLMSACNRACALHATQSGVTLPKSWATRPCLTAAACSRFLQPIDLGGGVVIDTPVILAPMSGVTDLPFRRLARAAGRRPGGLRDDRLLGDGAGEPQHAAHGGGGRRRRRPADAARRLRPGGDGRGGAHRGRSRAPT